ncbi:MAG: hypothetical protein LBG57_05815 [Treponema sp.]|jgi:hypothetical protein|nr:hypothetical protein [Treponema sp.]
MIYGKPPSRDRTALWKVLLFCVLSVMGNAASSALVDGILKVPLYLDTVFSVAVTFAFGLWPGILTGALLYPVTGVLYNIITGAGAGAFRIAGNVFILCTVSEITLVWFFRTQIGRSMLPEESSPSSFASIAARLMVLAALDCILISITGGIIDFVLYTLLSAPRGVYPEDVFKLGLYRNNVPLLAAAILSRIPINIVDRFIAIFGGYGISLLYRRCAGSAAP